MTQIKVISPLFYHFDTMHAYPNLPKPKRKKKISTEKEKITRITPSIIVSIANMIRSLHIFERFSIIRRFKYSFIERFIYLTMYLEGLYWKGMFGAILSVYFWKKNFSYPKNFWKKKICANQKGKKKSYRKKNNFFYFLCKTCKYSKYD